MTEDKRLNVDLPADLHSRFKTRCAEKGISITDRIRELIEKEVNVPTANSSKNRKLATSEDILAGVDRMISLSKKINNEGLTEVKYGPGKAE